MPSKTSRKSSSKSSIPSNPRSRSSAVNVNAIGIVYSKEFTEWVRDRRTLISTVLVPLLLFPIIMVGFSALAVALVGKAEKETPKIMILGGEDSPQVLENLRKVDYLEIAPYSANW